MDNHKTVELFERGWMVFALAMLLLFTGLILHAILTHGAQIATVAKRASPSEILASERFARPGVVEVGPNQYEVSMIAQAFNFIPSQVVVPAGAELTFYLTSRDVIHGYDVQFTTINVELIPGEVATFRYTFHEPREHLIICNQYCGIGHHNMIGRIIVVSPEEFAALAAPAAEVEWREAGPALYGNCVACHQPNGQGIAGAFPPLAGHAPELLAVDGGREYLIKTLLYGLQGPITVSGQAYNGVMPGFAYLSDEELAALGNYVLHEWDNAASLPPDFVPIAPDEVAALRELGLTATEVHAVRRALGFE